MSVIATMKMSTIFPRRYYPSEQEEDVLVRQNQIYWQLPPFSPERQIIASETAASLEKPLASWTQKKVLRWFHNHKIEFKQDLYLLKPNLPFIADFLTQEHSGPSRPSRLVEEVLLKETENLIPTMINNSSFISLPKLFQGRKTFLEELLPPLPLDDEHPLRTYLQNFALMTNAELQPLVSLIHTQAVSLRDVLHYFQITYRQFFQKLDNTGISQTDFKRGRQVNQQKEEIEAIVTCYRQKFRKGYQCVAYVLKRYGFNVSEWEIRQLYEEQQLFVFKKKPEPVKKTPE
jgi:hypothetical protein